MTVNGGQYEFLHESGWTEQSIDYNAVLGWEVSAGASQWTVEPVSSLTVHLNDGGDAFYGTLCVPFAYTNSGVANTLTLATDRRTLDATQVTEVPAGMPVMFRSESKDVTLTLGSAYAAAPLTTTSLTGTFIATTIDGEHDYVLGADNDNKVGFYHWETNALGANRAYVTAATASGTSAVKGFAINWDAADGISAPQMKNDVKGAIFNLAGQRLSKLQKGVNIVNGKNISSTRVENNRDANAGIPADDSLRDHSQR